MEDVGRVLVQRVFEEVVTTENLAAADQIMAEEYVEHVIAPFGRQEPGRVHGPSHARQVVEWLTAQFPDLEMTIESLVAEGDMVAVRVRSAGTNLGDARRPLDHASVGGDRASWTACPTQSERRSLAGAHQPRRFRVKANGAARRAAAPLSGLPRCCTRFRLIGFR